MYQWKGEKVYKGNWLKGERSGTGYFKDYNKVVYQGEWVKDLREGKGKETDENSLFDGFWAANKKHG
jgi:MORN repeat